MAAEPTHVLSDLGHIGVRELKNRLSAVLDESVRQGRTIVVTNHNRPDAVLVPPRDYEDLLAERERRERLTSTVGMLLAAVAAGVSVPSDTLEELGLVPAEFDWRALNAFQARYPLAITHDEEGRPLPRPGVRVTHTPVEEAEDEELRLAE